MITEQVEAGIDALSELAPLHNPACLAGIRGARAAFGPTLPMVAVFDTAFHQTMPEVARRYALPVELAERPRIRRYGFNGCGAAHQSAALHQDRQHLGSRQQPSGDQQQPYRSLQEILVATSL